MNFINVDPATYYEAATIINQAATAFFTTYSTNLKALEPTVAMAGSAGPGKDWAISYDQQARETNNLVTALTMLLDRYNRALNLIGYTYALSDHNPTAGTPPPAKPANPPLAFASCPTPPPSAGGPGSGLFDDGLELAKKIGVDLPVPDGDKDKLNTAATVWKTLAHAPEITNLPAELGRAADLFQTVTAPEVATIDDDLRTTKTAAEDLIVAFTDLANECAHQKTAHETMQGKLTSVLDTFAKELGKEILVTAAITVAASAITFGIGALAVNAVRAGKFVKLVDDTIELLRDIVRAAGLRNIVSLTRNTTDTRTKLERLHDAIETAEDTVEAGSKEPTSVATTPEEKAQAVHEIVTDDSGSLLGSEDAKGVQMVTQQQVETARQELHEKLGPPQVKNVPGKGIVETWEISGDPKSTVTYRNFSTSGGPTLDFNNVPDVPIKRWHILGG